MIRGITTEYVRMEEIESSINRYLTALYAADQEEPKSSQPKAVRLEERIAKLKAQMRELQAIEIQLNESPDKQDLTDRSGCPLDDDARYWNRWLQRAGRSRHPASFDRCS